MKAPNKNVWKLSKGLRAIKPGPPKKKSGAVIITKRTLSKTQTGLIDNSTSIKIATQFN